MGQGEKTYQQTDETVEHIVRRQVARKAMQDIQHQVEDIEQQVNSEKRNARYLMPMLFILFTLVLFFLIDVPQLSRLFSGWF